MFIMKLTCVIAIAANISMDMSCEGFLILIQVEFSHANSTRPNWPKRS